MYWEKDENIQKDDGFSPFQPLSYPKLWRLLHTFDVGRNDPMTITSIIITFKLSHLCAKFFMFLLVKRSKSGLIIFKVYNKFVLFVQSPFVRPHYNKLQWILQQRLPLLQCIKLFSIQLNDQAFTFPINLRQNKSKF